MRNVCFSLLLIAVGCHPSPPLPQATAAAQSVEWPAYGRDPGGTRYAPIDDITRENVVRLRVAWTYRTRETDSAFTTRRETSLEATPLVVDGTLYLSTPLGRVIALDPSVGTERWVLDPEKDPRVQ